jgi:hypothetical protein
MLWKMDMSYGIWNVRSIYRPDSLPLRKPRYRWEDNIKMDLRVIGMEGVDWIHPDQDRDQ